MLTNNLVTQSNSLIEAKHTQALSLREQKIILTFVSMIQQDDEDFKIYSLPIKEFHKLVQLKGREHYTQIKRIIKKLMEKTIEIPKADGGYLITHWATHVEYLAGKGIIQFSFEPKLKPYLLQLKRTFTSYRLNNIMSLGSYYSIRFYEFFKKWEKTGKWRTSLKHLKSLLGITQKSYEVYGNLKNRVIKPSIEELNQETDLNIELEEIKRGRQVVELVFKIANKKKINKNELKETTKKEETFDDSQDDLLSELNKKASNYQLDAELFNTIDQIASKIYRADQKEREMLGLIEYTNKNASKNYIGFLLHIIKEKEKIYKKEGNPSIVENELNLSSDSSEVIPEWFGARRERKQEKIEKELGKTEMEELKELLAKHSSAPTNS
ncbi:MAG TPA: replication initiation protein [Sphingobacterium sp.]|nr:replication initiation protein [Sphingobacterium sp.]